MVDEERAIEIALKEGKKRSYTDLVGEVGKELNLTNTEAHDLLRDLVKQGKLSARGEGGRNSLEFPYGETSARTWFEKWPD